jgi:hypothetical protein
MAASWLSGSSAAGLANTNTNVAVPLPDPAPAFGDVVVAIVTGASNTEPTYTPPPGLGYALAGQAFDAGSPGVKVAVYWRASLGEDDASELWSWDPAHGVVVTLSVIRGADPAAPFPTGEVALFAATASSATRTTPSITLAAARALVLAAHADRSGSTWTPGSGQAVRHDVRRGTASSVLVTTSTGAAGATTRTATASVASGTRVDLIAAVRDGDPSGLPLQLDPVGAVPAGDAALVPYATHGLDVANTRGGQAPYTHAWTQTAGPAVALAGSGRSRTFRAPPTLDGTTLTFDVVATDAAGRTSPAKRIEVVVRPHPDWTRRGGRLVPAERFVKRGAQLIGAARSIGLGTTTPPVTQPSGGAFAAAAFSSTDFDT